ncbi:MAG: trypsin-like peptidase domain-containing protein [Planctomycetes bacterium]|nr:trypsin-like peptidase domain-containing protein [Planctomycetota bacterium]
MFARRWVLVVVLLAGMAAGAVLSKYAELSPTVADDREADRLAADLVQLQNTSKAFTTVAKLVGPSVVGISLKRHVLMDQDDPFAWMFGQMQQGTQASLGTGVIVDREGYILTNNHVVEGAGEIRVTLADQREIAGIVVGTDPDSDLAVVKIADKNQRPARLGDSDVVEVGEWVVAIGNPFGLSQSVTSGIVSAKGRSNVGVAQYEGFLQTDAAINPGNSGGPLVNLRGEVIGITTAILSRSGGYQGIGFAIPINRAKFVMKKLIEGGRVNRGYLGFVGSDVNANLVDWVNQYYQFDLKDLSDLCKLLRIPEPKGTFVVRVEKKTPAANAGVKEGDLIVAFGGKDVKNYQELRDQIAVAEVGSQVAVRVLRDGKEVDLTVVLGQRPRTRR